MFTHADMQQLLFNTKDCSMSQSRIQVWLIQHTFHKNLKREKKHAQTKSLILRLVIKIFKGFM